MVCGVLGVLTHTTIEKIGNKNKHFLEGKT
jgi:hypothetical protein